jgi:hypothetical protein
MDRPLSQQGVYPRNLLSTLKLTKPAPRDSIPTRRSSYFDKDCPYARVAKMVLCSRCSRITVNPEVIHPDVKPTIRQSDCCQLTRYGASQ